MNSFFSQIEKLWSQFALNQKVTIIASALVIAIGMIALLVWSARPNFKLLYGGLGSEDMAEVVGKIQEMGIDYRISGSGDAIMVPPDQVHSIRMNLSTEGIPSGGSIGFEIFDKGNFGISDFHQRTNYNRAVQGELSRTISQLNGVQSARVMIVVPEHRLLLNKGRKNEPTASVFVETRGLPISNEAVNSIRFLVANAVEGLRLDNVAVIDDKGKVLSEELIGSNSLNMTGGQMRFRQGLEKYYSDKIEAMIGTVVGLNNVVANVSLDVNTDTLTEIEETYDPNSKVVLNESKNSDQVESVEVPMGGVTGAGNNENAGAQAENQARNTSTEKRSDASASYAYNRITRERTKPPGTVTRLSASVFVASKMKSVIEGDQESFTPEPRNDKEIKDLYEIVANALGIKMSDGKVPENITIKEIEFLGNEVPQIGGFIDMPSTFIGWTNLLNNSVVVLVSILVFIFFIRMVNHHQPNKFILEILDEKQEKIQLEKARNITPKPTPELLNELIHQKPENIGVALQDWANKDEEI